MGRIFLMKSLNPNIYTKEYYLTGCGDFKEYKKSFGKKLGPRLRYVLSHIQLKKGMNLLDIGCGRGESAFWAARNGAKVTGIDYSKAAIKLARAALKKQPKKIRQNVTFLLQNAKKLQLPSNQFDVVFLIDVLEHLYTEEQKVVLKNIHRVLKKGGIVLTHTEPNNIYINYLYRFWCYPISTALIKLWKIISGKSYPNIPHPSKSRTALHKLMHINEPTYYHLYKIFNRKEFETKIYTKLFKLKPMISWKDIIYNLIVFLHPMSQLFPLNTLYAENFIVIAKKR